MELCDLIGEHELSGVDQGVLRVPSIWGNTDANRLLFVLDDVAYQAIEDPEDGYRSTLREISMVSVSEVANRFPPVRVLARHLAENGANTCLGSQCDILELIDVVTGEVILQVGTDHTDDYYPVFVAHFTPSAMLVNHPTGTP